MQWVADSGSTKCLWKSDRGEIRTGMGLNPYQLGEGMLAAEIERLFSEDERQSVESIQFFGAGCGHHEKADSMKRGLEALFPKASIGVFSDMGLVLATRYQHESGLIGILGTGCNTGWVDDAGELHHEAPSPGFILGDEGSGSYIGKHLVEAWLYKEMPANLREAFEERFSGALSDVYSRVYSQPFPNRFLASFAPFAGEYQSQEWMSDFLDGIFKRYYRRQVEPNSRASGFTRLSLVGSVAWHFQDRLRAVLQAEGVELIQVLRNPLDRWQF